MWVKDIFTPKIRNKVYGTNFDSAVPNIALGTLPAQSERRLLPFKFDKNASKNKGQARTQIWTKDLLITSEMRYHCAIRAAGVHLGKVKYTNSIFSYFFTLVVKIPIGRLLPMKFANNVSKERDSAIAITLFHPSRSEFELRTFLRQFRK